MFPLGSYNFTETSSYSVVREKIAKEGNNYKINLKCKMNFFLPTVLVVKYSPRHLLECGVILKKNLIQFIELFSKKEKAINSIPIYCIIPLNKPIFLNICITHLIK